MTAKPSSALNSKAERDIMKTKAVYWALALVPSLTACVSQPVALAPVGPRPLPWQHLLPSKGEGRLQVYTATEEYEWERDVPFFPHRDYQIYSTEGKYLRRVWNSQTHEDETPAIVDLPAGKYLVRADAEFCGRVEIPVVIRPGELTRVVLQPGWKPSDGFAQADYLVQSPAGYFIGWRAGTGQTSK